MLWWEKLVRKRREERKMDDGLAFKNEVNAIMQVMEDAKGA